MGKKTLDFLEAHQSAKPSTFIEDAKWRQEHKIVNYDKVLNAEFGAPGTPERIAAEKRAREFYGIEP